MSRGEKRRQREQEKSTRTVQDLKEHKGLSKYQRKEMARRGIDISKIIGQGGPS